MISFDFILPRLATGGGIENEQDLGTLRNAGITHIIDCRDDVNDALFFKSLTPDIYLWNPTKDDGTPKDATWFEKSILFAWEKLIVPSAKLYVHCAAGVNRGPSTTYAIMRTLGWSHLFAKNYIEVRRPQTVEGLRYVPDADKAMIVLGYESSV